MSETDERFCLRVDGARSIDHHANMTGPVETAVRRFVKLGVPLKTPTGRGTFTVAEYSEDGLVLLLGRTKSRTPLPWPALEEVPDLLSGRSWVPIGSTYTTDAVPGTLDAHLKKYTARATGGWVAVVLERARVIEVDRSTPARVRLSPDWQGADDTRRVDRAVLGDPAGAVRERRRPKDVLKTSPEIAIDDSVDAYRRHLTPTARYASFDYCYNYFQAFHEQRRIGALAEPKHLQASCLQLGFYLASWGMLRGSSTLLQRSARNFIPVVQAIASTPRRVWSIDADDYSHEKCDALLHTVERMRNAYPDPASDTLITKTMLGVFGCIPAFDQYFKKGIGAWTLSTQSLQKIRRCYEANESAIESNRAPTIDFDTGLPTERLYPRAKVIDMIFFVAGGGSRNATSAESVE